MTHACANLYEIEATGASKFNCQPGKAIHQGSSWRDASIEIQIPRGLPRDFFSHLFGASVADERGPLAVSSVAYIPPLALYDAIIGWPIFSSY